MFLGEFGDVYKGIMKSNEGKAMTVAVKTLKVKRNVTIHAKLQFSMDMQYFISA